MKKPKPILVVKLQNNDYKRADEIYKRINDEIKQDYHVIISDGTEITVFNGEEVTIKDIEDFLKK